MKVRSNINATCQRCSHNQMIADVDTNERKIFLECPLCGYKGNIERELFNLALFQKRSILDQIDRVIKENLSLKERNPFWLEVLAEENPPIWLGD